MKYLYLILICLLAISSCKNSNNELVEKGMTQKEVMSKLGEPDNKHLLGSGEDMETGEEVEIEIWYYGKDTSVSFGNQRVAKVDFNARQTTEKLLKMKKTEN